MAENLKPFWPNDLDGNSKPIFFTYDGREMMGYKAELLPDVCDVTLPASVLYSVLPAHNQSWPDTGARPR